MKSSKRLPAVVWIQANAQSKPGAGVVIKVEGARAFVLTAYHVVQPAVEAGAHEVPVRFHGQLGAPSRASLRRDWLLPKEELTVVVVENAPAKSVIPIGRSSELRKLAVVFAIGHPSSGDWSAIEGGA
jgi:S1-C subfamily serine protease